jgi:3-oxoacyl-(acyl-carrier-protein) synthase
MMICATCLALGAATDHVPASSTKSMSGHLVSGAAAFEAIACLAAIDRQCAFSRTQAARAR